MTTANKTNTTPKAPVKKAGGMKKTPAKAVVAKKEDGTAASADPFDSKAEVKVEDKTLVDQKPAESLADSGAKSDEPKGESDAKVDDSKDRAAAIKKEGDAIKEEIKEAAEKTSTDSDEAPTGEWVVNTTKFQKDTEIKFSANPKRNGCAAWSRYERYSKAKTFGEYLELNSGKFSMADARYDVQKKFLTIKEVA